MVGDRPKAGMNVVNRYDHDSHFETKRISLSIVTMKIALRQRSRHGRHKLERSVALRCVRICCRAATTMDRFPTTKDLNLWKRSLQNIRNSTCRPRSAPPSETDSNGETFHLVLDLIEMKLPNHMQIYSQSIRDIYFPNHEGIYHKLGRFVGAVGAFLGSRTSLD
jgi:hypothetical protein